MATPRYGTHWEVSGHHPDKREPFDVYIGFYPTELAADQAVENLKKQGYEHINKIPPRGATAGGNHVR